MKLLLFLLLVAPNLKAEDYAIDNDTYRRSQELCESGDLIYCLNVGIWLDERGYSRESLSHYKKLCLGKPDSEYAVIACYNIGIIEEQLGNSKEALYYSNIACKGDSIRCAYTAHLAHKVRDYEIAKNAAKKACLQEEAMESTCYIYALSLVKEHNKEQDSDQLAKRIVNAIGNGEKDVIKVLKKSCDSGHYNNCPLLGEILWLSGDSRGAVGYFKRSCINEKEKDMFSCYKIGNISYELGNREDAIDYYRRACNEGSHQIPLGACSQMITIYDELASEKGDDSYNDQAYYYTKKTCDYAKKINHGTEWACHNWAVSQYNGDEVEGAKKTWQYLCDQNHQESCDILKEGL